VNAIPDILLPDGEAPALRVGQVTLSRHQLRSEVFRVAKELGDHGVTPHSCVLFRVAPGLDFVTRLLATLHLGAQLFVVDHRLSADVLAGAARSAGVTHEFASASALPATRGFSEAPTVVKRVGSGAGRCSDHVMVQMSSGTTDEPKLIGRDEPDVLLELDRYRQLGGIAPAGGSAVVAAALPSAWGLYGGLCAVLGGELELVLAASTTPRGILAAVAASDRSTVVLGVPIHVSMLASIPDPPGNLAGIVTSGAAVPAEDVTAASAALGGVPVGQVYGMTEIGMIAADPRGETPGSVGRFGRGLRTRLGERDELEIAVPSSPYLDEGANQGRWSGGWFRTHDAVSVDPAGTVTVRGRLDGLVSFGGKKFHVTEVEHHLKVDEAVEDAVVFVDGGRVEAFVTVPAGRRLDERRATDRLPEYMRPHLLRVVDQLPRTVSGKVQRRRELLPPGGREGTER
jgi:3-hydroxy-4-methylanthranilate adenylyltransferase